MEEIKRLHVRLQKFTRGETSDKSEVLDVLRLLEKATITLTILKETQLGKTVGKLRKDGDEKVANMAKLLVKNWKSIALSPRPTSAASPAPSTSSEKSTTASKTKSSTASTPQSTPKASPAKPTPSKSSGPFIPAGLDKIRASVRTKLKETLEMSEGGNAADVATAIEISMARMFSMGFPGENKKEYSAKFRQLSFNLKKNAPLREDLLSDMVSAEQLINMSPEELATEEKRAENQRLRDDAFNKARLDWAEANEEKINKQCGLEGSTGLFTCGRCKSSKTSNTQKQTRSADEPMTVFVHCHNCGNRWKC
ncbi:TPA: hypothetical protein N0F65_012576 [Lagenidium giganteum]|uniref:Transcription elongation factor n=1 Tax=Lagenidium giganteum TaxID=4803 RepID=A0AAV2YSL2_9STRA|nr:TPA: hypothetical protein N0F65_012576 [Lagenidium giganteum]